MYFKNSFCSRLEVLERQVYVEDKYRMTADILSKQIKIWEGDRLVHKAIGYREAKVWIREQELKNKKIKKDA